MQEFSAYTTRLTYVALALTIASAASAQDTRWVPWIGCWQPAVPTQETPEGGSMLCVSRAGANSVEIATIDSGRVLARDTIDASGAQTPTAADGCTGSRSGQWSSDGRRVYLRSELNCSGGIKRISTGVLAFTSDIGWIDVRSVRAGSSTGTRSTRYIIAESSAAPEVPAEFSEILRTGSVRNISRVLAGGVLVADDVADASKHVDAAVIETWLSERGQSFNIDGKTLAKLARAGVPGSVTDVMVGVSYPERFEVGREPSSAGRSVAGTQAYAYPYPYAYAYPYDYYNAYDYRYGYRDYYGYGRYGDYGRNYTTYYDSPVSVSGRQKVPKEVPHGTMVNGQGYTRGRPSDNSTVRETSTSSQSGSSSSGSARSGGSSSSGSSSSGSSSSGSSGGGASSGRTAHKKGG